MNRFITALATLLIAASSAPAWAQMHGGMHARGMGGGGELRMYLRAAGLTPDQKAKIKEIRKANFEQVKPLFKQLRALRGQIADKLASAGTVSAADIAPLQQQIATIREQIGNDFVQTALQVRGLLTADQLTKVSETYTKMKTLRQEMRSLVTPPEESGMEETEPATQPAAPPTAAPATGQN
jgi:Spy/CpxP family protein refolding chaperone